MFDMMSMVQMLWICGEAKAENEGREYTSEEREATFKKVFDAYMNVGIDRDMARAGFVQGPDGQWQRPQRGWLERLLGWLTSTR